MLKVTLPGSGTDSVFTLTRESRTLLVGLSIVPAGMQEMNEQKTPIRPNVSDSRVGAPPL